MADESLREIQLNGKQLVFVFMAATVVAVVIFLSGVMVGRTVPDERDALAAGAVEEGIGLDADLASAPAAPSATGGPVAANEVITYPSYLEASAPPEETLGEVPPPVIETIEEHVLDLPVPDVSATADDSGPAADDASGAPDLALASGGAPAPVVAGIQEPAGDGFVVQVAAVSRRPEAEAIAADLRTKGYPAFVTTPGSDATLVYRVRVGKYPDRREAESIAGRLELEEQFRPWITR